MSRIPIERSMRILVLHSRYRSGSASGENRVVDDEVRLLQTAGHAVEAFQPQMDPAGPAELLHSAAGVVWSIRAPHEVAARIDRFRPDVVHVHNLFPALSPAVLRAVPSRIPLVMTLHNYRLLCLPGTFLRDGVVCEDCLGRSKWPGVIHGCYQGSVAASAALATSLELHRAVGSFDNVDLYVAISRFVRAKHIEAGLPGPRIVVKPHFSWPSSRRDGPGSYFLFLGRLSPEKGGSTLVEVFRRSSARLIIVGEGPDGAMLRRRGSSNLEFRGTVEPDRVPDLLAGARALLVPSLSHEGAGKVVLEAYAASVPVLASEAGGLPEVVDDGQTGFLLPPGDVPAWTRAVDRMSDDELVQRMGAAGLAMWKQGYGPDQGLANLEAVYEQAVQARARPAASPR